MILLSLAAESNRGLTPGDWAILGLYVAVVLGMAAWSARRQKSSDDYFLGGRQMSSWMIGISLFVTLMSTISYLGNPGEIIKHGPFAVFGILSIPVAYLVVGYWLIPKIMQTRVTSVYELLESKFGPDVRLLGASCFLLLRLVWMSLMIFLTSKALVAMLGLSPEATPWISVATGIIAIIYTSIGGLRTVVATDFLQFVLLLTGGIATLLVVSSHLGGIGWLSLEWHPDWDAQPLFSWNPTERVTLFGAFVSFLLWQICTHGSDQTAIQRFMATGSVKAARRSFLISMSATVVVIGLLTLIGLALLAYATQHPDSMQGMSPDQYFPWFLSHQLPAGITGLVLVGLFAAAMSSVDSGVNSISAVIQSDFLKQRQKSNQPKENKVTSLRWLSFLIGLVVITLSFWMDRVPGNFLEVTNRTTNLLVAPIFGLFLFAFFIPFATRAGVWAGWIAAVATAAITAFSPTIPGLPPLSFQWVSTFALTANLVVGIPVSLLTRPKPV